MPTDAFELVQLGEANMARLPEKVMRPTYDRNDLKPGIVHIGVGNFFRAHQAWYLHRLLQDGLDHDWAIIGAGVTPYDITMREKLQEQDFLTTLIELDPNGTSAEVIGSVIDYLPIEEGNGALVAQLVLPETRIVAMTVTEGGYFIDAATNGFDAAHPDIQHDAANPDTPWTAFGAIIAALKVRRAEGIGPFTCMSCDNIMGNGAILRQTVVSLARMSDPALADWIEAECSFPNSMVDCIVPATGPNELDLVKSLGINDAAPVTHENFRQWVIEDDFCAGRPAWEKVGATLSDEVHLFEAMKLRVLNGGHQVIAVPAQVLGVETIAGCMTHALIGPFLEKVAREEIVPHVKPVSGMKPDAYARLIESRFSNPKIVDTTRRVAFDGSSRHPGFILPTIRDGLSSGAPISGLALLEAAWARMCAGTRQDGDTIEPNDPNWAELNTAALAAKADPSAWLEQRGIYGDLADNSRFAEAFGTWLTMIWQNGLDAALETYLKG